MASQTAAQDFVPCDVLLVPQLLVCATVSVEQVSAGSGAQRMSSQAGGSGSESDVTHRGSLAFEARLHLRLWKPIDCAPSGSVEEKHLARSIAPSLEQVVA